MGAALALALCAALAVGGCGGGGDSTTGAPIPSGLTGSGDVTIAGKTEPEVEVPEGPPPKKLVVEDLEDGSGPEAKVGDFVTVEYTGYHWNGRPFSDSWTYPEPPTFKLGGGGDPHLEYGLDVGIRGMKAGGRREVLVPSTMIYWPDEPHPHLSPVNAVAFIVDLVEIH